MKNIQFRTRVGSFLFFILCIFCLIVVVGVAPVSSSSGSNNLDDIQIPDPGHAKIVTGLLDNSTRELSKIIRAYKTASGVDKTQLGEQIKDLAKERKGYLLETIRRNPGAAFSLLLTNDERLEVSAIAPDSVEELVTVEGELEVIIADFFDEEVSVSRNTLTTSTGERVRLHFVKGHEIALVSGKNVRANGYRLGDDLLIDASDAAGLELIEEETKKKKGGGTAGSHGGGSGGGNSTTNPNTHGVQQTLVLLANFQNTPQPDLTPAEVYDIVFNQANDYYQETSFNKVSLAGDVFGWYEIPVNQTCTYYNVQTQVIEAADADVDFTQYSRLIVIAPFSGCGWAGLGTLGLRYISTPDGGVMMSTSWIVASYTSLFLIGHELGHNFGAHHASYLNCGDQPITSPDCILVEYGDRYAIMGSGTGQWNAPHKDLVAGWLEDHNVLNVTEDGIYTINPIEIGSDSLQALKIVRKPGNNWCCNFDDYLFVEYRQPIGYDANFPSYNNVYAGALLHILAGGEPWVKSGLIDPTLPSSSSTAALEPGQSFTDQETGTNIAVLDTTPDTLTVAVTMGTCMDFNPPTVTITSPTSSSEVTGTVTVVADAFDLESGIQRVEFYRSGTEEPFAVDFDAPYSAQWDSTKVPNGWNALYAIAYDNTGPDCTPNQTKSRTVGVYVLNGDDSIPPTIILTAPQNADKLDLPITFKADATDNTGVYRVEFWLDPAGVDMCGVGLQHNGPHPPFCRFWGFLPTYSRYFAALQRRAFIAGVDYQAPYERKTYSLPPGNYTAWAQAVDFSLNRATSEQIWMVVKGQRPFRVIILSPANQGHVTPDSLVTIAASPSEEMETSKVEFFADDELICVDTTPPYTCDWQVPADIGVTYTIDVEAFGLAGRTDGDFVHVIAE